MDGFPDGHVTDYGKAVDAPLNGPGVGAGGFRFPIFDPRLFADRYPGACWGYLVVALIAFVLVAVVAQVGVPWYFGTHLWSTITESAASTV